MSGQWHADPLGRADHRYYDGAQWTRLVATAGQQSEEDESLPMTLSAATPAVTSQALTASVTPTYAAPTYAAPAYAAPGATPVGYVLRPAGGGKLLTAGILSIISGGVTLLVGMAMKSVLDSVVGVAHVVCNAGNDSNNYFNGASTSCNSGADSASGAGTMIFIVILLLGIAFMAAGIGAVMRKQWGQIATIVVGVLWTLFSLFLLIKSGEAAVLVMVIWCGLIAGLAFFENRQVFDKYARRA